MGGGSFGSSSGGSYGGSSSSGSYRSPSSSSYGSSSSSAWERFEWPPWAPWCLGGFVALYIPLMIWNASIPGGFAGTALEDVASPASLAAVEIIWSPAAEEDRMSTAELEQRYPELRKIDETAIAGRVFCAYCRGLFAMELLECPHCGAPIEARPASLG